MQKLSFISFILILGSCSSNYYHSPESISSKMERYKSKNQNKNMVPYFQTKELAFSGKTQTTKRGPASAGNNYIPLNNKKFYFLTLLEQYKTMSSYLPKSYKTPEINFCPHFHSSLVDYNESTRMEKKISRLVSSNKLRNWDSLKSIASSDYPELNLPVTEVSIEPKVVDILGNEKELKKYSSPKELIYHAMSVHVTKTYRELNTLCEYGNSPNYYHYENLLGHIERKGRHFKANTDSIKILLKTTLYSNMTLLNSYERNYTTNSRIPASTNTSVYTNPYYQELLKRFNAPWAKNYLREVK